MRPFGLVDYQNLDDKRFILVAANDRVSFVETFSTVSLIVFGIVAVIVTMSFIFEKVSSWQELGIWGYTFIALSITTISLYILRFILKPNKFEIFDRENRIVTIPKPFSNRVWISAPWDEWQGRIRLGATSVGASNHHLMLTHLPTGHQWELTSSIAGVDWVLSYWSFLVQYMNKDQPLPNVGDLNEYGNTTDGLGTWQEFEANLKTGKIRDPWEEWQIELSHHPELDPLKA